MKYLWNFSCVHASLYRKKRYTKWRWTSVNPSLSFVTWLSIVVRYNRHELCMSFYTKCPWTFHEKRSTRIPDFIGKKKKKKNLFCYRVRSWGKLFKSLASISILNLARCTSKFKWKNESLKFKLFQRRQQFNGAIFTFLILADYFWWVHHIICMYCRYAHDPV